jgi:2-oxoisovalerate dehydrogenase E2 component (dihydrolipoyl transacylase)
MAHSMSQSRDQVAGSTVCDDADIHLWTRRGDYMLRLMRAMVPPGARSPLLNAWYDPAASRGFWSRTSISPSPSIRRRTHRSGGAQHRRQIAGRTARSRRPAKRGGTPAQHPAEDLRDFTLMLSNFGTLAGRYGIPSWCLPAVAILGAGKVREDAVVAVAAPCVAHRRMPLSLSFDHRCITGGEACRFLAAVIGDLERPD